MPRFSFRGRFRSRYGEFERSDSQAAVIQARTLAAESHLFDIAEAHCDFVKYGTARITCWPSPEGANEGRRWGRYKSVDAVIMPFRTKASLSDDSARLSTYELELFLRSSEPESCGSLSFSKPCPLGRSGEPCNIHSEVCLVELPAPESMTGHPTDDNMLQKPWKFRSEVGCSCGNSERAAKWIWDANGHDPITLHGGLALQHQGGPFFIACRVRGQALIQDANFRLRSILKFGNEPSELKWWKVEPKASYEDLTTSVAKLEDEIRGLNTKCSTNKSSSTEARMDNSQSHQFAPTTIGGHATAILGNLSIGSDSFHRLFNTGDQQYNPEPATLRLPQSTGS